MKCIQTLSYEGSYVMSESLNFILMIIKIHEWQRRCHDQIYIVECLFYQPILRRLQDEQDRQVTCFQGAFILVHGENVQ